ncbi:MAG: hypothetical protein FD163_1112 [Hyphomonadaceae bacterium]|nr:MAG: hypothetical protein FD163_1112 [Hyphomonadaceae bacterium]
MKTNKKLAFISLGAVAMAIIGAYSYSNGANAQAAQEPAAPKASSIPRHVGSFSAGLINAITYTPSCPGYVFPMDAAAIQESRSRAFVEAEVIRFRNIREGMDNYEDCMIENARRDIDVISGKLSAYLTAEAGKEAANYSALGEAARANADRIRSGGGGAAKKKKGAPATAAPAETGVFVSTYTKPTGRQIGSITAGTADAINYSNPCGAFLGEVSANHFANVVGSAAFNSLVDYLQHMPEKIEEFRACRNEQTNEDYDLIQLKVQDGVNAVFVPVKTNFERQYNLVNTQLNLHRQPGGLLAPASTPRPKAPAPAKKKRG